MFKNWNTRDWFWLSSYFIVIIGLLLANFYWEWETNLSIISSAASIALAIIAIFLSLKQDSDSKVMSHSMQKDIQSLHQEFLRKQAGYNEMLDEVENAVDDNIGIQDNSDENKNYSHEELIAYGEKIKQETIVNFRSEIENKLEENLQDNYFKHFYNNLQNDFEKADRIKRINESSKINKIIRENADKNYKEVSDILKEKGFKVPINTIIVKLKKFQEDGK